MPKNEIADPLLAPAANHEIGRRQIRQPGLASEHLHGNPLRVQLSARGAQRQPLRNPGDLLLAAIGKRHHQVHPVISASAFLGLVQRVAYAARKAAAVANATQADAVVVEKVHMPPDALSQKRHQAAHFAAWPLPILAAQPEQREGRQPAPGAGLHDLASRLHASLVAIRPRQAALERPAAVPVHDDRQMLQRVEPNV